MRVMEIRPARRAGRILALGDLELAEVHPDKLLRISNAQL